jgi:phospholipase C
MPAIAAPTDQPLTNLLSLPLNDLQKSLVTGAARRFGLDPAATVKSVTTRQHAEDFFRQSSPQNPL